jgi:uncharacterized membrane protein YdcZ (DUF606 family)
MNQLCMTELSLATDIAGLTKVERSSATRWRWLPVLLCGGGVYHAASTVHECKESDAR